MRNTTSRIYQPVQLRKKGALSLSGLCIVLFTGHPQPTGEHHHDAQHQADQYSYPDLFDHNAQCQPENDGKDEGHFRPAYIRFL